MYWNYHSLGLMILSRWLIIGVQILKTLLTFKIFLKKGQYLCRSCLLEWEMVRRMDFPLLSWPYTSTARHVFGTLIGLGSAQRKLRPQQKPEFKAHLTLLDIHFATIARDLLLCMLIHILVENQLEADARLEVQTTLVYVYIGWAMPDYCSEQWAPMPLLFYSCILTLMRDTAWCGSLKT